MFYQILSLRGKFELNEANIFILTGVLEKIVLNLHSPVLNTIMRLLDTGQKNFAFTMLQTGWQMMICLR